MDENRKAFEERLEAELKEWNAQTALLRTKARRVKAELKAGCERALDLFLRKQGEARATVETLKTAGDEAWETLRPDTEQAWTEERSAYREARSAFK